MSGYGVELAIKNQEYKAKDDTQVQGKILRGVKENWYKSKTFILKIIFFT